MKFYRFINAEQLPGALILGAMIGGLATVNSPLKAVYLFAHHVPVYFGIGSLTINQPLILWINDGLMVSFFLLVGVEIKRAVLDGHLSTFGQAALPAFAAVGGMIAPALIYTAVASGNPVALRGWAVPMATDIVLAVSVLALLGRYIPNALRVFLMALAIFDDIGAVLIIGLFYGKGLAEAPLAVAGFALLGLWILNKRGIVRIWPYVVAGGTFWMALLSSGFEAALAGVLIGIALPMRVPLPEPAPLLRVERRLRPLVSFAVIPLFAFFNSGVEVEPSALNNLLAPQSLGIIFGLFVGKPVGIVISTWIAVRLGAGRLPTAVTWLHVTGVAVLAGIGFTMSLFVATLAFPDLTILASAKIAVLTGSLLSGVAGLLILYVFARSDTSPLAANAETKERL